MVLGKLCYRVLGCQPKSEMNQHLVESRDGSNTIKIEHAMKFKIKEIKMKFFEKVNVSHEMFKIKTFGATKKRKI